MNYKPNFSLPVYAGLLGLILSSSILNAGSVVYNMVYRRAALPVPYDSVQDNVFFFNNNPFALVKFDHTDEDHDNRVSVGDIITARTTFFPFWLEAKTAVSYEHRNTKHETDRTTQKSHRVAFDDVLLFAGYDFIAEPINQLSFYGLGGIRTTNTDERGPLVGTGYYGVGCGFDGAYGDTFADNPENSWSFIGSGRFIHMFPGRVNFSRPVDSMYPDYLKIHPGNFIDLLVGSHFAFGNHHVEFGYDATIPFGSKVQKLDLDDEKWHENKRVMPNYIDSTDRTIVANANNTFYINYTYATFWNDLPVTFGAGTSYAFDHKIESQGWAGWLRGSLSF